MKKKLLLIFIISIFFILMFNIPSYAGEQDIRNLKYEVQLKEDGSAAVTEIWHIDVEETNTLFKTFILDSSKYGKITNVKVEEISTRGKVINFIQTNTYAYHVDKGKFYALETKKNEFEIAWGVSIGSEESKIYRISYTIENAVKNYNDCSEFYWQFIGDTNEIPVKEIEGTIKLPKSLTSKEDFRVWAHGPLNRRNTNVR
ncbi:MAG: DUF2207 domain-containing protein [Clostridia bacterium]|nr:DUF2207 domain-containing protein [Clostridia bacterium]